jgi:hypothetical protein
MNPSDRSIAGDFRREWSNPAWTWLSGQARAKDRASSDGALTGYHLYLGAATRRMCRGSGGVERDWPACWEPAFRNGIGGALATLGRHVSLLRDIARWIGLTDQFIAEQTTH